MLLAIAANIFVFIYVFKNRDFKKIKVQWTIFRSLNWLCGVTLYKSTGCMPSQPHTFVDISPRVDEYIYKYTYIYVYLYSTYIYITS